jgi:uncharacterized protein YdgA (DUF945 family)
MGMSMAKRRVGLGVWALGLVAFGCVGLALVPAGVGYSVGDFYAPDSPLMQKIQAQGWAYTLAESHVGWFSSEYTYRLSMGAADDGFGMEIRDTVTHGPLVLSQLSANESPWVAAVINSEISILLQEEGKKTSLPLAPRMRVVAGFDQQCVGRGEVPAVKHEAKEASDFTLMMDTATLDFAGSCLGLDGKVSLNMPVVYFKSGDATVRLDNIALSSVAALDKHELFSGDVSFEVRRVALHDAKQGNVFSADGLTLRGATKLGEGDVYTSGGRLQVGAVQLLGQVFNNFIYDIEVSRLDAQALKGFEQWGLDYHQTAQAGTPPSDALGMEKLTALGEQLLAKHPQLALKQLSMETAYGKIEASALVETDDVDPASLQNPLLLAQGLRVTAHAQAAQITLKNLLKAVHRTMIERSPSAGAAMNETDRETLSQQRADEQLNFVTAMGVVKAEGDQYISDIKFEKGQLTVNGQPFALGPHAGTP